MSGDDLRLHAVRTAGDEPSRPSPAAAPDRGVGPAEPAEPAEPSPRRPRRARLIGIALAVLLIAGLGWRLTHRPATSGPAASATPPVDAALELPASDLVVARRAELLRGVPVSGGLRAVDTAMVKAKVAAELLQLTVREGDAVRAGQVIGRLDTRETAARLAQAEQQAANARAQWDIAQRNLANSRALVGQGFISPTALESAQSNAAAAQASWAAARAAVDLARKAQEDTVLRAPIDGQVSQRLAQPGERVGVDARIVEIVDLRRMELETALAPADVAEVRVGQSAVLRVDGLPDALQARVARIAPATVAGSRSVNVYLALPPHPALRQGWFATGTIELERRPALVLPPDAIRTDQAQPTVLALEDGRIVQRTVVTGVRGLVEGQPAVELRSGVAEGARVLAGSAGLVPPGTAVKLVQATAGGRTPAAAAAASQPAAAR